MLQRNAVARFFVGAKVDVRFLNYIPPGAGELEHVIGFRKYTMLKEKEALMPENERGLFDYLYHALPFAPEYKPNVPLVTCKPP